MDPLYVKKILCPCCSQTFGTSRVRPSLRKAVRHDSDFCAYFKEGAENPDFYVVRVCPFCGFASTDNSVQRLNDEQRRIVYEKITSNGNMKNYCGKRTLEDAMNAYKLALLCAQIVNERPRVIAGILHHIAWLYRYKGDRENEQRFLRYALNEYIRVYETDSLEAKSSRLMYLIGELHRRLKEFPQAIRWFSRVINDKSIMDASMIRASRDAWTAVREEMVALKMELPEELKESAGK